MEMRVKQIQMLLRLILSSDSFYFLQTRLYKHSKKKKKRKKNHIHKEKKRKKVSRFNHTATTNSRPVGANDG